MLDSAGNFIKPEKKPYKKYDDEAFRKDLKGQSEFLHRDEIDVK